MDIPAHPTREQLQAEYETVWRNLEGRPIEGLIDLPLMTDPDLRAAMQVLSILLEAAYFTDFHFYCLVLCRMVNVSIHDGVSGASAHGYGLLGTLVGHVFQRYGDGYRFAKLACDLVEKHGFVAYQSKVWFSVGLVAPWTQPLATAIEFNRAAVRIGTENGDRIFACYGMDQWVMGLLLRNDPLDAVRRESERGLDFARKTGYRDGVDTFVIQQRFIAAMQGRTATFSTFSDAQFDEAAFEAQLTKDRLSTMVCGYWILKLKARFLSGDYAEALAAADQAKALLAALAAQMNGPLDYFYYTALTVAALYESGSADDQTAWRDLLTMHREQLRQWAENYPPTFADKHALVSAEIARLEGREGEAMRLYERAIELAREHGFVQNEGLAHEVAARFYAARAVEAIADTYRRNARYCYLRWGADGKVRQLEQLYPHLREDPARLPPTATIGAPVRQLDVETVVKASQALSSEIVLPALIETLMRIAVEHAGAERGLLILLQGNQPRIKAEATTGQGRTHVTVRQAAIASSDLPQSALQYVIRTQERVVLDDASVGTLYSEDEYVRANRARSVLCLPIVKQRQLIGALYLENNLTPRAFTSDRVAVLEMLAAQAAISLENATLYSDLQRSEAFLADGQSISHTGSFGLSAPGGQMYWSEETYKIFQYDRAVTPTFALALQRVHPDDRDLVRQTVDRASEAGTPLDFEHQLLLPDGSVKHVHVLARALGTASGHVEFVGAVMDVTAAKQAEEQRERLRQAQADLARVNRVTTMGELTASLAHEVNQPIAAALTDAKTCFRWLTRDHPDVDEAREAAARIIEAATRAADIIGRLRVVFTKGTPQQAGVDVNEVIRETVALLSSEIAPAGIAVRTELAADLPQAMGDRVQLQQVLMNLMINGIDAMKNVDGTRELAITSQRADNEQLVLSVSDTGVGLPPQEVDQIFNAFFTTKPHGTGMGLRISRSIVESHGGRLWAADNSPRGARFCFTLPTR
jgi:PAS domain S-box-containing protein